MESPRRFEPTRLRLARDLQQASQSELARASGLTPAAISQFESGSTRPGATTIDRFAEVLRVPADFFYMQPVDAHEGYFRSLRRSPVSHRRRARAIAHIAHDAVVAAGPGAFPAYDVPELPVHDLRADHTQLEEIAHRTRSAMQVPRGPVADVVDLLERHGVVVIRLPLDTADVDAFSLPFADHPVVILGSDKGDRARSRFDAAHELGHLAAHQEQAWGLKEIEQQAHMFAAAFLMPASDIHDELPTYADWPTLFDLKRRWQVSLAALLMRARTLGRLSPEAYLTAVKAASARGWRRAEPVPLGRPEQPSRSLALLASPECRAAMAALPGAVVDSLVDASAA
ncbi:MAG TPA: XRE family transcriptional regulator [Mycobacteriales bacterium]|nr:XRE family transcriptional regulator [Mycobacteriales bacterium]